jgi:hypothetical protein
MASRRAAGSGMQPQLDGALPFANASNARVRRTPQPQRATTRRRGCEMIETMSQFPDHWPGTTIMVGWSPLSDVGPNIEIAAMIAADRRIGTLRQGWEKNPARTSAKAIATRKTGVIEFWTTQNGKPARRDGQDGSRRHVRETCIK